MISKGMCLRYLSEERRHFHYLRGHVLSLACLVIFPRTYPSITYNSYTFLAKIDIHPSKANLNEDMTGFNEKEEGLEKKLSQAQGPSTLVEDPVFGEITESGPNYRNVGAPFSQCN